jgi:hypothetical protein
LQARREIVYEVKDPAFCFTILEQPQDLLQLSRDIARRMDDVEKCKVRKQDAALLLFGGECTLGCLYYRTAKLG